jgi:hypothetical protein
MGGILDIFGASKTAKAQKQAADKAAQASQYATDQSLALQREQFNRIWEATAPSRKLGDTATGQLQGLADGTIDPTKWLEANPGYQTNLQAGQRQINASAAAKGGLLSGDAAKAGLKFGADYATGVYNQERNALLAMAGLGQTAVNTGAQTGQATTNASQNALQQNAQNLATSYGQKADATAGLWGTITGTFGNNALAKYAKVFAGGF